MQYLFDNKIWEVEYEVEDANEHMYNILLVDDEGNEVPSYDLPAEDSLALELMVDEHYSSSMPDSYEYMSQVR